VRSTHILPDKDNPLLTRELVYTGLTRARTRVEVWFQEAVLRAAVNRKIHRGSGLRDRLCGGVMLGEYRQLVFW
jgi:exodeoxyribonuclease V alpha subunit